LAIDAQKKKSDKNFLTDRGGFFLRENSERKSLNLGLETFDNMLLKQLE